MYSKQEASQLRKKFWTQFGQYMRPLSGAGGERVNWLNYKTGVRHIYFRMDADNKQASVSIELRQPDATMQQYYFDKFMELKPVLEQTMGEKWDWELFATDDDKRQVSRIGKKLNGVNVFNESDWPAIISFLKPGMLALDTFWDLVKEGFE
jgi:hypothetical protein